MYSNILYLDWILILYVLEQGDSYGYEISQTH